MSFFEDVFYDDEETRIFWRGIFATLMPNIIFQANGIKIGPQHSPANPNMPAGSQGGGGSGGCC